jgi:hypothetical protein
MLRQTGDLAKKLAFRAAYGHGIGIGIVREAMHGQIPERESASLPCLAFCLPLN